MLLDKQTEHGGKRFHPISVFLPICHPVFAFPGFVCEAIFVCASSLSICASECVPSRRLKKAACKQAYTHVHSWSHGCPQVLTPLPFFPSQPPMCPSCPNPFPGRKALIEGAGFSLWPVGAHYCVFISKWGLPDWFNIHVSASYFWPSTHRLQHCQISPA